MEYNEKLSHLTPDQIDDIVRMYSDKTFKVADIINKYNIDVPVTSFIKILPPIKTDKICEYCGEPLYRNVTARINSFYTRPSDMFCLACGHHVYDEQQYGQPPKCTCEGCKEREQQERARKQELIRKRYERNHTQIQFKDLELGDQIKFIYVLYNNPEQLHSNKKGIPWEIAPVEQDTYHFNATGINYLHRLIDIGVLSVSPKSPIEAFVEKDFPRVAYIECARYTINVTQASILADYTDDSYFLTCDKAQLLKEYKECLYRDLIKKFEDMLYERRLDLHISENANERFKDLIGKLSYLQILTLCKRVAVFFSDKVVTGSMNRRFAKNAVLINVSKFYDRCIASELDIAYMEPDELRLDNGGISAELKYFLVKVLEKPTTFLKEVPSIDNICQPITSKEAEAHDDELAHQPTKEDVENITLVVNKTDTLNDTN